jgi:hypothetical protein
MELNIQELETKSKFINDIVEVRRFRSILFYELSTSAAFILQSFWPVNLYIIIGAAALFTPYMLYVLIKERKFFWILTFFIVVVLPYPVLYLIVGDYILLPGWMLLPIISFYFYCFIIKFSVEDWLREYTWEQYSIQQRNEEEERKRLEGLL